MSGVISVSKAIVAPTPTTASVTAATTVIVAPATVTAATTVIVATATITATTAAMAAPATVSIRAAAGIIVTPAARAVLRERAVSLRRRNDENGAAATADVQSDGKSDKIGTATTTGGAVLRPETRSTRRVVVKTHRILSPS